MPNKLQKVEHSSPFLQFIVSFVIPIIILTRFSSDSQLGPTKGLLLALAFPVAYEIYSVYKRRKLSMLSILAIGGILVTGLISLLGLSEGWLAIRRGAPYLAMSIAIFVSVLIKHPLLNMLLPQVFDMKKVHARAQKNRAGSALDKHLARASTMLSVVLMAAAIASFILTKVIIMSETDTAGFNQEYAKLRLISLPAITLPMFIGIAAVILYLVNSIEKLTGLDIDDVMNKKSPQKPTKKN